MTVLQLQTECAPGTDKQSDRETTSRERVKQCIQRDDTEMGTETDLHAERYSRAGRLKKRMWQIDTRHTTNRGLQAQRYKQRQTQTDIDKQCTETDTVSHRQRQTCRQRDTEVTDSHIHRHTQTNNELRQTCSQRDTDTDRHRQTANRYRDGQQRNRYGQTDLQAQG
jgi:hypothetical protein